MLNISLNLLLHVKYSYVLFILQKILKAGWYSDLRQICGWYCDHYVGKVSTIG